MRRLGRPGYVLDPHGLGSGDGGEDAVGDLAAPRLAQQKPRLAQVLRGPGPVGREFQQGVVLENAIARHVAGDREGLAQAGELAQRRDEARRGGAGLDPGPGLGGIGAVGRGIGQHRQLLLDPRQRGRCVSSRFASTS